MILLRLLLFFFLVAPGIYAQEWVEGKVWDASSTQPLAFVNIIFPQSGGGVSTDIDGSFRFRLTPRRKTMVFSYLGYERDTLNIHDLKAAKNEVYLESNAYDLAEVTILPGVNPAHRIIEATIANKEINNPEKAREFYYESYNKLVVTADPDSAYANLPDSLKKQDTSSYEVLQFLENSHLFMMESVTERNHIPPTHTKEVVKASRISGMKTPLFTLIGTQLQSFSLYNDYIKLLGAAYLSPISKGSTDKYLFVLEDTLFQDEDTVYSISYRPRKGKFFDGLQGIITINTDGYAVQNFIAETKGQKNFDIKIQQKYEKINGEQWFPVQLNTTLFFRALHIKNFPTYAEGRSYIKNIELSSRMNKKQIGNVVLKMKEDAGKKDSSYWSQYRENPLDEREHETYRFLDSLGEKINLDRKIKVYQAIFRGAFPLGPMDVTLNRLMDYNAYEKFRLGFGAETNDQISKHLRVGGYGAYGFGDHAWKYGGHLKWNSLWDSYFGIKLSYAQDVVESGGINFYNDWVNPFSTELYQKYFIQRMDAVERFAVEVETHSIRDFQLTFFGNVQNRSITSNYRFNPELIAGENSGQYFRLAEAGMNLRFAFREKFIEMFGVKTPISFDYPIVHLKYSRGFSALLDGDYAYNRFDLKVQKSSRIRNLGYTSIRLNAGYIDRSLPLSTLFRARGSLDPDLRFASDYSFQSVAPNEFYHDRYFAVFFKHSFKNLIYNSRNFKPELTLVSAFGLGEIRRQMAHENVNFKTMEKGFFESGIQLDRLIGPLNLGVGAYYRYGAYRAPAFKDNWYFKATYTLKF